MAKNPVFLYLATFASVKDARAASMKVQELYSAGVISVYDAAVVSKDAEGKVRVHKNEKATQYGVWTGLVVGAVVGTLFPPLLAGSAAVAIFGAGAGGLMAHFRSGMSRSEVRELAELVGEGEAALIVVGKSPLGEAIVTGQILALRQWERRVPATQHEFEAAVAEAVSAITSRG